MDHSIEKPCILLNTICTWVQCNSCCKWRRTEKPLKQANRKWYCSNAEYNCEEDEETWEDEVVVTKIEDLDDGDTRYRVNIDGAVRPVVGCTRPSSLSYKNIKNKFKTTFCKDNLHLIIDAQLKSHQHPSYPFSFEAQKQYEEEENVNFTQQKNLTYLKRSKTYRLFRQYSDNNTDNNQFINFIIRQNPLIVPRGLDMYYDLPV